MLQKMGEHIHGWIAGIFVVVISVIFALFGISYYLHAGNPGDVVLAKVNGEKLTAQMLQTQYTNATRQNPSLATASSEKRTAFKKNLVKGWVKQQAVITSLKQANMLVSPDVIRNIVLATPGFQINGHFSTAAFNNMLQYQGLTEDKFYQLYSNQMIGTQFTQAMMQSAFVLPKLVQRYFTVLTQQRTYRYALIQASDFANQVQVSTAVLKAFYQKHIAEYKAPETVSVNYIKVAPSNLMAQVHVDPASAKAYYQAHKKTFTMPKSWKFSAFTMSDLRSKYLSDSDAQINKKFADQVSALKSGTNIAAFLKMYKPVTKPVASFSGKAKKLLSSLKPGQVSAVQNDNILKGKTVYYMIATLPKHVKSFADAKKEIVDHLQKQQLNELLSSKSDQMTNLAYSNPEGLKQVAATMGLSVKTTKAFTRQGLKAGPASNAKFIAAAFGDIVLTQGVNSDPITLKNGSIVIMHLNKHTPAASKPFSVVKVSVAEAYIAQQSLQLAKQHAQALAKQLNAGQAVQLSWHNMTNGTVKDKSIAKPIVNAVFEKPFAVGDKAVAFVIPVNTQQVAVAQLQSLRVKPASKMTVAKQTQIQQQLLNLQQKATLQMLQNSLRQHSKIKVYLSRVS